MKVDRYNNLRNIISDIHGCICDNNIMYCKLQAVKEFLEEEMEKTRSLKQNLMNMILDYVMN